MGRRIRFRVFGVFRGSEKRDSRQSAVGIGTTGRGTFAAPEIQPKIQSVGKHQKHAP
jgi:hypothetical protein